MRNAFADEITQIAKENKDLVFLSGDIGNKLFDRFKAEFPDRFLNCGVAEANMTSVAAGLALSGLRPVTYTIASFNTFRCFEQIRIDLAYHNLPVLVVGVGAGLSYSELGGTHHSCEDLSVLRALPNMTVLCPADPVEVRLALRAALELKGPVYMRIGKKGEPVLHPENPRFEIGVPLQTVKEGQHKRKVCLLGVGNMVAVANGAAARLEQQGISARVLSCHTVKPLNADYFARLAEEFPCLVTIEEASIIGGFGSAIAEWMMDSGMARKSHLLRIGTPDAFPNYTAKQKDMRKFVRLDENSIVERVTDFFRKNIEAL